MKISERLASYSADLKFEDIPKKVVEKVKEVFLDLLGCTLAGSTAAGCKIIVDIVNEYGGKEESTLIAYGGKKPAPLAALANGTMGHALDFDDTHDTAVLHTSVCVVPAALALAERQRTSGKDFITAITAGMEIHCRMGVASKYPPPKYGWIYTPIMGTFGATCAASKILGLNKEGTLNALGICYSEAAGNSQSLIEGTLAKRLQAGLAAKNGVLAAVLAEKGFTGPKSSLEGKYGFYKVYLRGSYDPEKLVDKLGSKFEVSNLSLKPYPCCRWTHSTIDAVIGAKRKYGIKPEEVESIDVGVSKAAFAVVCEPEDLKYNPVTIVDAQFSLPYVSGCAMIKGDVFIDDFQVGSIKRTDVLEMTKKVRPRVDEGIDKKAGRQISPSIVRIRTRKRTFEVQVDLPLGHPKSPLTYEQCYEKFRKCSRFALRPLGTERVKEIGRLVENLERLQDISELTSMLVCEPEDS